MTILNYAGRRYIVLAWKTTPEYTYAVCADCETGAIASLDWPHLRQAKIIEYDGYKLGRP